MPDISPELEQLRASNAFDEVYEVVRTVTLYSEAQALAVRLTLVRYYWPASVTYDVRYERRNEHGGFEQATYPAVLNGDHDEETTLRMAISFVREAHGL